MTPVKSTEAKTNSVLYMEIIRSLVTFGGAVDVTLLKNTLSLYIIHFANYVLPLITIPYLVRVLGPANYGAVAFAQSLISYFMVLVDYGFDLSATRRISVHRDDPLTVSRVATNTWAAKGLLCALGFVIVVLLVLLVPQVRDTWELILILYGLVIGNVLFPTWLFQGMERMVAVSLINLGMRLLVVIGMFRVVQRPDDYVTYGALLSIGSVVAGAVGFLIGLRAFELRIERPSLRAIREALMEGWPLFLATAAGNVYVVGNSFLLGLVSTHSAVGYYNAGERIVRAVVGVLEPVVRAAYPRSTKLVSDANATFLRWFVTLLLFLGGIGLALSVGLALSATVGSNLLLGAGYERPATVIRILAPLPFLIAISSILGPQLIVSLGLDKVFTRVLVLGACVDVAFLWFTAPFWAEVGAAFALLVTEAFVTGATAFCAWQARSRLTMATTQNVAEANGQLPSMRTRVMGPL